jgi:hypothetical protein
LSPEKCLPVRVRTQADIVVVIGTMKKKGTEYQE